MNNQQLLRYSRHILLDDINIDGQEKFLAAHLLIVGAGGLGSPVAMYLAAAGVGYITLVDSDNVELANLQRQILHTSARIGKAKVSSARITMMQINPDIQVVALAEHIDKTRLSQLTRDANLVIDCSDNFATRQAINHACVTHQVPLVSGSATKFDGQVGVFNTNNVNSPCYACLFPPNIKFAEITCSAMGVFSPLLGIIGSIQAAEALKLIAGIGTSLSGFLLMLNARNMEWTRIGVARDISCSVCGEDYYYP